MKRTLTHHCTCRKAGGGGGPLTFNLIAGAQQRGDHGTGPSAGQGEEKHGSYLPSSCHAAKCVIPPQASA